MADLSFLKDMSQAAYDAAMALDFDNLEEGKYQLADGIYFMIQEYEPKTRKDAKLETHDNFADVQMVCKGTEIISMIDRNDDCVVSVPYNSEKDITFYEHNLKAVDYVLSDGDYLVIPNTLAHMPKVKVAGCDHVRKAVFKVPMSLIK